MKYVSPKMENILLMANDVITKSGSNTNQGGGIITPDDEIDG